MSKLITTHFLLPVDALMKIATVSDYNIIEKCPNLCLDQKYINELANQRAINYYALSDRDTSYAEYAFAKGYEQAIKDLLENKNNTSIGLDVCKDKDYQTTVIYNNNTKECVVTATTEEVNAFARDGSPQPFIEWLNAYREMKYQQSRIKS